MTSIPFIVFVVCMLLWLISVAPFQGNRVGPYSGIAAWLAVLSLAFLVHVL
jgi:hypothetical protein